LLLAFFSVKSQSKSKEHKLYFFPGPIGYYWQDSHNFEVGMHFNYFTSLKRGHDNISFIESGIISPINGATYLTQSAHLRYYDQIKKTWLGWEIWLGYSYTNIHKQVAHWLTPEAGFGIGSVHITYGYNISAGKYKDEVTLPHRVALRLNPF
jgi:hypothetical protein